MPTMTLGEDRRLHYLDEGVGDDTVVFLHAFPLDSTMWQPQIRALGDRYRIVAPDLAGLGESDPLPDPADCSVEALGDDVIALVELLGLGRVTLVGTSLGGDVALSIIRRDREIVDSLLISGVRAGPTSSDDDRRWADQADWIAGDGDLAAIIDRAVDEKISPKAATRSETAKLVRVMIRRASRPGWVGGLTALRRRPDPTPDLGKIDVPTLVVAGMDDPLTPPGDTRLLADRIPGAGLIELEDAAHLPNLENPALFTAAVEDLLVGREARRQTGKHTWPATPAGTKTS